MLMPRAARFGFVLVAFATIVWAGWSRAQTDGSEDIFFSVADCEAMGSVLSDSTVKAVANEQFRKGACFGNFQQTYSLPGVGSGWRGELVFGPLSSSQTTATLGFRVDIDSAGQSTVRSKARMTVLSSPATIRLLITDRLSYELLQNVLENVPPELEDLFDSGYRTRRLLAMPAAASTWMPHYRVLFQMSNGTDSINLQVQAVWDGLDFSVPIVTVN